MKEETKPNTLESARQIERDLGLRIADCPECGDAITKSGQCCYCDYKVPDALPPKE